MVASKGDGSTRRNGSPTFRPLAEAVSGEVRRRGQLDVPVLRPFRPALGRLVPEWHSHEPAPGGESPVVLGEGLVRLLGAVSGERGCVLVLEDLHWADPESLAVLEYLADNVAAERIVCVWARSARRKLAPAESWSQRARCVPVHVKEDPGDWVATDIDWDQHPGRWSGGHGLYSTPRDYLRFQQLLLGGGTFAGATILDRSSAREAFTNQIGDHGVPAEMPTTNPAWSDDFVIGPGKKWGWGLLLNTSAQPGMRATGSGSWTGIFNTHFWVDPHTMITGALYTQSLPFATPEALQTYTDFERALYGSSARSHATAGARPPIRSTP